ncbi:VHS domain-containing protein [Mycena venus]|uniref:VHS domain-containing protein n=1 Tax=Mycena venus TaxID=2733690 RepID=A0A8H6XT63_9AGAR|nr:VHS domain-containing protein [Mycena venus]
MSFQHFRLSDVVTPLPQHIHASPQVPVQQFQAANTNNTFPTNQTPVQASSAKAPYGSGDTDDGYTLVFPDLAAFHEWRQKEEEAQMVEFVKGDTHGSKAVPPRFKDHTKLVCARHSRSGRKKYVKKHPDRVRKVPSRKLEGEGCGASISFKTYYDTEEVRACYISQHSHEVGLANLPYTRRGRKAAVEQEKQKSRKQAKVSHPSSAGGSNSQNATASTSTTQSKEQFSNAISMLAPLPAPYQPAIDPALPGPSGYTYPQPARPAPVPELTLSSLSNDRWENMATPF